MSLLKTTWEPKVESKIFNKLVFTDLLRINISILLIIISILLKISVTPLALGF